MNIHLPGKGWRQRIGEEGVEWLLTETIEAGKRGGLVKDSDLKRVIVDTTVMEKNIAHPTDARLYETARRKLVGLAREAGIGLRQNYNRLAPRLLGQVGRYAHDGQGVADCLMDKFGPEVEIIIRPPKNAVHGANTQRNQHIDAIAENGRMKWQTKTGYNQRSQIEAQIGRWKQVIGDRLQARDFDNQTVEAQIASKALNRMTALGRAAYERVF